MTLDYYKDIGSLTSILLENLEKQHPNSKDVFMLVSVAKVFFYANMTYSSHTNPHHMKTLDSYCILKVNDRFFSVPYLMFCNGYKICSH